MKACGDNTSTPRRAAAGKCLKSGALDTPQVLSGGASGSSDLNIDLAHRQLVRAVPRSLEPNCPNGLRGKGALCCLRGTRL
jgi:hypothetical protein